MADSGIPRALTGEFRVPGAWELPQAVARIVRLEPNPYSAVIALGCVVRGESPHFDYICSEAARGLGAVARSSRVPVTFGVLTTDDLQQALARSGAGNDNKGYEAASAALEMINLFTRIPEAIGKH